MKKIALISALSLVLLACGSDSKPEPTTQSKADGKAVFVENCGACHTLKKAGTVGEVGPELTNTALPKEAIAVQVSIGGGGMPAFSDTLSKGEINAVAAYTASTKGD